VAYKFRGFFISLRRYTVIIGKQLLISNDRNRVRSVILGFTQDGACTDLLENLSVNSFKGDLSNAFTFKPPLFSLDSLDFVPEFGLGLVFNHRIRLEESSAKDVFEFWAKYLFILVLLRICIDDTRMRMRTDTSLVRSQFSIR
jgi:hypothetical protein